MKYNSLAWLAWATGAAVPALLIRNPFYLLIIAVSAWLVFATAEQSTGLVQSWRGLLKLGVLVWVLTIPFNALMVHLGTYVLFRLPTSWPLVGGNITLEAVAYGVVSGLSLWVLLLIFTAFNVTIDASQLLRLVPSFLYQAGVVTSIAMTFMPQMLASAKEIREAQQIRGHRFRGWRDMLPLLIPLLTTGFERAVQLAESMESRGFGGQLSGLTQGQSNRLRLQMLLSLALLLCGLFFFTYWPHAPLTGILLMLCASLVLVYTFWALGRHVQRSHYRRSHWQAGDTAIVLVSVLVCAAVIIIRNADKLALVYYPYPPYALLPDFSPWIGLVLMGLAVPGLLQLFRKSPKTGALKLEADTAKDTL